jgi:hypothetical protein
MELSYPRWPTATQLVHRRHLHIAWNAIGKMHDPIRIELLRDMELAVRLDCIVSVDANFQRSEFYERVFRARENVMIFMLDEDSVSLSYQCLKHVFDNMTIELHRGNTCVMIDEDMYWTPLHDGNVLEIKSSGLVQMSIRYEFIPVTTPEITPEITP